MKKFLPAFLVLLLLIVISACAAQKKTTSKKSSNSTTTRSTTTSGNAYNSNSTGLSYVQMWRTPCFGRCPNYKLELYSDGTLRYTGYMFTEDTGIYEKNIGAAAAQGIFKPYNGPRIDTLSSEYQSLVQDLPGITYVFKSGNVIKQVRNAHFGPVYLRELANEMDVYIKKDPSSPPRIDKSWKKISDSPRGD